MADIRDGGAEALAGPPEGCPKQTIQTMPDDKSPRMRPKSPLLFNSTAIARDRDRDATPAKHVNPDDPELAAAHQDVFTKLNFGPSKFSSPVYEPSPAEIDNFCIRGFTSGQTKGQHSRGDRRHVSADLRMETTRSDVLTTPLTLPTPTLLPRTPRPARRFSSPSLEGTRGVTT